MENWIEYRTYLREKDCPQLNKDILIIRDSLDALSGKWTIPVFFAVLKGNKRFSDIMEFCSKISDKVLSNTLKDLTYNKLLVKNDLDYELTEHGMELCKVLKPLWNWGVIHRKIMLD